MPRVTLETPIERSGLSARARNALRRSGHKTLGDLVHLPEKELRRYVGIGEGGARAIRQLIEQVAGAKEEDAQCRWSP